MATMSGVKELIAALKKYEVRLTGMRAAQSGDAKVEVIVGYTAAYAIFVHENLEMKLQGVPRPSGLGRYWGPPGRGQNKFLEQPARERGKEMAARVYKVAIRGGTLAQALVQAGWLLQRYSQKLVPVEYGNLKQSAFTRLLVGDDVAAAMASQGPPDEGADGDDGEV